MLKVVMIAAAMTWTGCAALHHVQVGEIEGRGSGERFEIRVSNTGVDLSEAATIARATSNSSVVKQTADTVDTVWQLMTFGPRTGNVTFSDDYADKAFDLAAMGCRDRPIAGIVAIRETTKYPVVSGEIVRVFGYCREGAQ